MIAAMHEIIFDICPYRNNHLQFLNSDELLIVLLRKTVVFKLRISHFLLTSECASRYDTGCCILNKSTGMSVVPGTVLIFTQGLLQRGGRLFLSIVADSP